MRRCHRESKLVRQRAVLGEAPCRASRKETWDRGVAGNPLMSNIKRVVRVKDDSTLQIWGDGRPLYRGGLQVNDSTLQRDCYGVRSVACAKFGKNVLDVALDCFLGNRELIGNQLI